MKRFLMAVALACALSSSALAGIVHSTDAPAPAPQPSSSVVAIILTLIGIVR